MAAKSGHAIGATTIGGAGGAGVGGGVGVALADVLVELVPRLEPVELSLGILFAAALAYVGGILGGKFSPSSEKHVTPAEADLPPSPSPDFVVVDPEDEGRGGPDLPGEPAADLGEAPADLVDYGDERSGSTKV